MPPPLAAADLFEILAALIFLLISAGVQWLQKKGKATEVDLNDAPPPLETPPRHRIPANEWEESIRRMLEGPTAPPPPLPPAPPRPLPHATPEPEPPPWRPGEDEAWESVEAPNRPLAHLDESAAAHAHATGAGDSADAHISTAAQLGSASRAVGRASQLSETIQRRLRRSIARTENPDSHRALDRTRPAPRPSGSRDLRADLRLPATARQAFIASLVFGPPKGLE